MDNCPICLEKKPENYCGLVMCLVCRNLFCKSCIFSEHSKIENCPMCRSKLFPDNITSIRLAYDIIDKKDDFEHIGYIYYILGMNYRDVKDFENALKYLHLAAEKNVSCAQNVLSHIYSLGKIVEKDLELSEKYKEQSLENNCAASLVSEASRLILVENKLFDGIEFLKKASSLDHPKAQCMLAVHSLQNNLMEKEECIALLESSFSKGLTLPGLMLAKIYENGLYEIDADNDLAMSYYEQCVSKGNLKAMFYLAENSFFKGLFYEAAKMYLKIVKSEPAHEDAMKAHCALANCYYHMSSDLGHFMFMEALINLEYTVDEEYAPGMFQLGKIYLENHEYRKPEEGFNYIKMAADNDYYPAYEILAMLYENGIGTETNIEMAEYYKNKL